MCRERWRTRDRLLEYDTRIMPVMPHQAGLQSVYPWENMLAFQIYDIARKYGFEGEKDEFWSNLIGGSIISGTIDTFPTPGSNKNLYLDTETDILYYYKEFSESINKETAAIVGAAIVGQAYVDEKEITQMYIPVRALLIEDTLLDCGDSTG